MGHGKAESNGSWWGAVESDPVHLAAVEWLLRLQDSDVSADDTLAWQEWLQASPRHAEAFARLEQVSLAAKRLVPEPHWRTGIQPRDTYDASLPVGEWRTRPTPPQSLSWRRNGGSRSIAIAASVLALLLGFTLFGLERGRNSPVGPTLETAVGQNETFALPDGSTVTLGGNSKVLVAYSNSTRDLELARGEAFFVVVKQPLRPFRVHAGDATVTALGTQFNVHRDTDHAVVAVTEGRVLVEPSSHVLPVALLREFKPNLRAVPLSAGEQTITGAAGIEPASKVDDPTATTSWQTGRLAFRLQPLKYVLEDVNRYTRKPIVLADASVGDLVITGTVTSDGVSGWIGSLERGFGLVASEEPDRIVIRRR